MRALAAKLWFVSIVIRIVATAILFFGPWTDSADELNGWDIERFHEIAVTEGQPYVDFDVEYPPGSVVAIEALATPLGLSLGVVGMHRSLLLLSLIADLATAGVLRLIAGGRSARIYLLLGLPLVPMGLLRLDLVAGFFATVAFWAMVKSSRDRHNLENNPTKLDPGNGSSYLSESISSVIFFGASVTAGTMVKIWPGLVVAAAISLRRVRHIGGAIAGLAVSGVVWLLWVGNGLDPIGQVLSLRGATGWHVESTPGSIVALFSSSQPRLELNAFRIGTLTPSVVSAGRILSIGLMIGLITAGLARTKSSAKSAISNIQVGATVALGCTASLLVTAPLLSPQFILWLTPWAALLAATPHASTNRQQNLIYMTGAIATTTGVTLVIFGPPGVSDTVPAALLVLRNLALAGLVGLCFQTLRSTPASYSHLI